MTFEVQITTFAPDARLARGRDLTAAEAADAVARAADAPTAALLVGKHAPGVSHGDFSVWLSGDRALVRLDEHREWHAAAPGAAGRGEVEFRDEDGSAFAEPFARTVSRAQALDALAHWLRTGERAAGLAWS